MDSIVGPHHRHPHGEIDLVMPLTADAKFDGHGPGWVVYAPDSAHRPTVTDGEALVYQLRARIAAPGCRRAAPLLRAVERTKLGQKMLPMSELRHLDLFQYPQQFRRVPVIVTVAHQQFDRATQLADALLARSNVVIGLR
jgi:hypothetical protein